MAFSTHLLPLRSQKSIELIDVTAEVSAFVRETKIKNGLINIMSQHTTASICVNESCDALEKDLLHFLKKLTQTEQPFEHNKIASDGRPNAHSHLLSYLTGCGQTLPIIDGKIQLGTWQKIFFVELDGPRPKREILLSVWGDS